MLFLSSTLHIQKHYYHRIKTQQECVSFFSDDRWLFAQAPISSTATSISFIVYRGSDYQGDIAIDDVRFDREDCVGPPTPGTSPMPPSTTTTVAPGMY